MSIDVAIIAFVRPHADRIQDWLAILQHREERATSLSPVDVVHTGVIYITLWADDV